MSIRYWETTASPQTIWGIASGRLGQAMAKEGQGQLCADLSQQSHKKRLSLEARFGRIELLLRKSNHQGQTQNDPILRAKHPMPRATHPMSRARQLFLVRACQKHWQGTSRERTPFLTYT